MTSTTVASHTSQPLNFGPEWLRALSTPDATTTPLPTSGGSASGNVFKFSTTKYRYSKDQILALRANVTERLAEDVRNAILENLKDVESVFRPNIIEPLTLTAPTGEENARLSSLSSYISGRTPGGGGRGGHSSQQSSQQPQQSHESRSGRGGSASANGRGGGTRGRGGRETNFGSNRGNNNGEDNGENSGGGTGGDESSAGSSWSRGTGFHNRNAGGSFNNRVRSYDDREQSQPFRRGGGGGGTRQTGEVWRRTRGDDDDNNNDQNDESNTANGPSWNSRSGTTNRPGGSSIEHRTKSSDKWSHKDDRPGQSSSFESNQSSSRGAWRTNSSMSDRDLNARRPTTKRDRMPEWMDDNNDTDGQLSGATFDQNGTFTGPSTSTGRSNNTNNSNQSTKLNSQSSSEEVTSQPSAATTTTTTTTTTAPVATAKPQEETKPDKSTPPRTDTAVVNVPNISETIVPKATPPIQPSMSSWDDDFEPSDVATTVVEATLAEDHDYSPPVSSHPTPHPLAMEPTPPTMPIIPPVQRSQPATVPMSGVPSVPNPPIVAPVIDDKQWFYRDPQNTIQGPFSSADMERWFAAGYFTIHLPVKRLGEAQFSTIQQLIKELGRLPFRSDAPSLPPPPPVPVPVVNQPVIPTPMQTQSSISENQKFNLMNFPTGSSSNASSSVGNAYLEEFLLQQQQQSRQNIHPSMLFNRQTSMPSGTNERKSSNSASMVSSHMQGFFSSSTQPQSQQHHQSSSSLFSNNLVNDPSVTFSHQVPQLQRSISATNNQPLFDEIPRSFHATSSTTSAASGFFVQNMAAMGGSAVSQQPDDIITRLAHAMQSHGQQQQEKAAAAAAVVEQQRRELELQERLKLAQQAEQARLREEEELRKKQEAAMKKQMLLEQMKEMNKHVEQKKAQQTNVAPAAIKPEIDPFIALQQSLQFQKEQQAKIEAQKAENVRRYQQQLREQSHPSPPIQSQQTFKLPETVGWARQSSQSHEQISQPLNFAEIQKQEQEQERRAREAALAAQQMAKTDGNTSSSNQKGNSWARTLFAGSSSATSSTHPSMDHDTNESHQPESPITSYNQQATNAVLSLLNIHPKSRSTEKHSQSAPWNTSNTATVNPSLQDIQRQQQQQLQNEVKQQQQQQQQQSQSHSNASTPAWGSLFSHSNTSSQSMFWADQTNAPSSAPAPPPASTKSSSSNSGNKSSTPWNDVKPSSTNSGTMTNTSSKSNSNNADLSKSEREAKGLFNTTRTQDALSKWAQTQFKDNLQAIDVPTLVQLLKDIDSAEEIVEYVQPYIGSVSKSREFARDFLAKRKQLTNAEPELDNERLNALAMAPTSSSANSQNAGDEGFQVASSNGQKKKAKKMKGQKIDVKQLGFMVNNRPEHRDDIDRVQM